MVIISPASGIMSSQMVVNAVSKIDLTLSVIGSGQMLLEAAVAGTGDYNSDIEAQRSHEFQFFLIHSTVS